MNWQAMILVALGVIVGGYALWVSFWLLLLQASFGESKLASCLLFIIFIATPIGGILYYLFHTATW